MLLSNTVRQRSTPMTSSVNNPWSSGESFAKREECSNSDAYASVFSILNRMSNAAARAGEMDIRIILEGDFGPIHQVSQSTWAGTHVQSPSLKCVSCLRAGLPIIPALSSSRSRRKSFHLLPEAAPEELSQHSVSRL